MRRFTIEPEPRLLGRQDDTRVLDQIGSDIRAGRSRVLLLRGEAGVGKTALLDYLAATASGCRIVRAAGVEPEMDLPFAGLHQLCASMLGHLDTLPEPQRAAVGAAFGLEADGQADRYLVGLAVLNLLDGAAHDRPLVCIVDDVHWLDRASAEVLAFVARRLLADPVALVFAVRSAEEVPTLRGLPERVITGLSHADAAALLDASLPGPMDERVRSRILAESRGNPLALLELIRGSSALELAGGFGLPETRDAESHIERSFIRRVKELQPDARRLLHVAAAEPVGDVAVLRRAAERLGIAPDAEAEAQASGLADFGTRVRFRHPLVRSAAYRTAPPDDRRAAHAALAAAMDPTADPDRHVWHRSRAAAGPDEELAGDLVSAAGRARARGGVAAAAAFLDRAATLTPDRAQRSRRALAAAQAAFDAAATDRAEELLAAADLGGLDDLGRAMSVRLRAQIAFARDRGSAAVSRMIEAAGRLTPLDGDLARAAYLEALGSMIFAGRFGATDEGFGVAAAARSVLADPPADRLTDLLLDAVVTRLSDGYAPAVPRLERALRSFRAQADGGSEIMDWLWMACPVAPEPIAPELWDDETWHALAVRAVDLARGAGALGVLPAALAYRAGVSVHEGDFAQATALIEEGDAISTATGTAPLRYTALLLAGWRGDEHRAVPLIAAAVEDATRRGEGRAIGLAEHATAVLYNGLGGYEDALAAARRACEYDDLGFFGWSLAELVEAAARSGRPETGRDALRQLDLRTTASGTDWALGMRARSTALLAEDAEAERLYTDAIERLARTRGVVHLARAELVYGEWLRRQNRRGDARHHLHAAYDRFTSAGAEAFAERARRELKATGLTARRRTVETRNALTAQEAQIVGLAVTGRTNVEIGQLLFISPRTVEYHLSKVFTKLGVTSRRELQRAVRGADVTTSG